MRPLLANQLIQAVHSWETGWPHKLAARTASLPTGTARPANAHPHSQYWIARSVTSSSAQHSGQSTVSSIMMSCNGQARLAYSVKTRTLHQAAVAWRLPPLGVQAL